GAVGDPVGVGIAKKAGKHLVDPQFAGAARHQRGDGGIFRPDRRQREGEVMGDQLLHLAGSGSVNRAEFCRAIIEAGARVGVIPHIVSVIETTTSEYAAAARRPTNCVLDCSKARALGIELAPWHESLTRVVQEMVV
ncbi:MAG: hypothetical protein EBU83_04315, partial [bacterium]|nr:hypothetical protein [Candidatus Aquidulcis sp.]